MVESMIETRRPCEALLPGHQHCQHGHTEDCPDPGECELLVAHMPDDHVWRDVEGFAPGTKQTCACGAYRYPTIEGD